MNQTFNSIQILRGAVALLVVLHHFMQAFYDFERTNLIGNFLSDFGAWGVDVFFVISGFIMVYIVTTKERTVKKFALNRLIRVVPNYWFYTLIIVILGLVIPIHASDATMFSVLQSLFFIPHENPSNELGMYPTLSVGWTLNYEMFFYGLVAISLMLSSENLKLILGFVALTLITLPLLEKISHYNIYYKFYLFEFVMGMFLYAILDSRFWRSKFYIMLMSVLLLVLANHPVIERLLVVFLIVLLVLSLESFISPNNIASKVALFLVDISYSIYLSHIVVLLSLSFFLGSFKSQDINGFWLILVLSICLIFTLVLSILSYKLIEVRLSKWLKSRLVSN